MAPTSSNEEDFAPLLEQFMSGVLAMRKEFDHPLFNATTPLALVTGGGPGAMELGNRVAKSLGILSCANIVDFRNKKEARFQEQGPNPLHRH